MALIPDHAALAAGASAGPDDINGNHPEASEVFLASHVPGDPVTTATGASDMPVASANGAFVAFASTAPDLVAGQSDSNGGSDIFLFDRATGAVSLVSHTPASATTTSSGHSYSAAISADGAYVAFVSSSTNLVPGQRDTNFDPDAFLYERATGTVTLVSHTPAGPGFAANRHSSGPVVSEDGSLIAFSSPASDLVAGQSDTNNTFDVFLFRRATGAVSLVSHTPAGATVAGNQSSHTNAMSADGAVVAFLSASTNLVVGQSDANARTDVFLFDRATGAVSLVSHVPFSPITAASGESSGFFKPSISTDGAFVAFESKATDLVPAQVDSGNTIDVFLYERSTGTVRLVSHVPLTASGAGADASHSPAMSADGAFVAFRSDANNLVVGQQDGPGSGDVFLFERATGAITLVSHLPGQPNSAAQALSTSPSISGDGSFLVFQSLSLGLVRNQVDTNGRSDSFLYDRATGVVTLVSHTPGQNNVAGNGSSHSPTISTDGKFVVFPSSAHDLVVGQRDVNNALDIFLVELVSRALKGPAPPADFDGNGSSDVGVFRPADGTWFVREGMTLSYGTAGDVPVPADYDGDGVTDVAVFRPSVGFWFIHGQRMEQFGVAGDIPVPGDYNGDGAAEVAVFRPSSGFWFVENGTIIPLGTGGDIPVPADYDGSGTTDMAVFRPSTGLWFVRGGSAVTEFGTAGDVPVPGDYNGDGAAEIATFRPSNGFWFVRNGDMGQFGVAGDVPIPADYDGNGMADVAVFRAAIGHWCFMDGAMAHFGTVSDIPLTLPSAIQGFFFGG